MAFFGLFGDDRQMAATTYRTRESATDRCARREAEREARAATKRRRDHHRHAAAADRKGRRWEQRDHDTFGD